MKILYVTTVSDTVNTFLIPHIKMLIKQGHIVDVAFNINQELKPEIAKLGCKIHIVPFSRSPLNKDNYKAYKMLKKTIVWEKYDLIHTHTPIASACVRVACKNIKDIKIIYTAHGFHFFKGAPNLNWLIYYSIERLLSRYTDILITINKEDYNRARKSFKTKRIEYIPGVGINLRKLNEVSIDKSNKRRDLGIQKDAFVLLSVGELNKNKNHETVIKALAKLNNPKIHYLICGQGELENYLSDLAKKLGLEKQVHLLGFRKDVIEVYKASDLFVFPSYREGLSVALMEAMACGLPVVCSDIRGNTDLIEEGNEGYLIKPDDVKSFAESIEKIYSCEKTRKLFKENTIKQIEKYSIQNVLEQIEEVYKY